MSIQMAPLKEIWGWLELVGLAGTLLVWWFSSFSIHKGVQTINLMEGLVILYGLEQAFELGWHRVICESDSQVLVNLLNAQKVVDVSWQLAVVVQHIL